MGTASPTKLAISSDWLPEQLVVMPALLCFHFGTSDGTKQMQWIVVYCIAALKDRKAATGSMSCTITRTLYIMGCRLCQ